MPCIHCNHTQFTILGILGNTTYVRCHGCGMNGTVVVIGEDMGEDE